MSAAGARRAIIVGGGIGGLLSAAAAAASFDEVLLLERDDYPPRPQGAAPPPRPGVPQSRCLHMLTVYGMGCFDALLPGWRREVEAAGGERFDLGADARWCLPSGAVAHFEAGLEIYACSRFVLEQALRRRLDDLGSVRPMPGTVVDGLRFDPSGEQVCGVLAQREGQAEELAAELVVDVSGRGSALAKWLDVGARLEETVVKSAWAYCGQWFEQSSDDAPPWKVLSIAPPSAEAQGLLACRSEGPFWGVALLQPVGRELQGEDLLDAARELESEDLERLRGSVEAVSSIHRLGAGRSRRRAYEKIEPWPRGLAALGDSVCALDPLHGLGMSAAAGGAKLLREHLQAATADGIELDTARFQRDLAQLNQRPWELTTGRSVDGGPPAFDRRALRLLSLEARRDPTAAREMLEIRQMVRPAPPTPSTQGRT